MPPQSRAQRRRQTAQQRSARTSTRVERGSAARPAEPQVAAPVDLDASDVATPLPSAPAEPAAPARSGTRRARFRATVEPVDYTKDYLAATRDLRWIAIWAVLLFVGMVVLRISGLV